MFKKRLESAIIAAALVVSVTMGPVGVLAQEASPEEGQMSHSQSNETGVMQDTMMQGESGDKGMMGEDMMEGEMMDEGMMAMHDDVHARAKMMNERLDALVAQMEAAQGKQKIEAIAAVVAELVAQHKSMHAMMVAGAEGMSSSAAHGH
jgi:hypothetical protein